MSEKFTRADIQTVLTASGTETIKAIKQTALIIEAMAAALAQGRTIEFRGFGTLEPRTRKARKMRNPRTLEPVEVPARCRVLFRPGQELKAALRGSAPKAEKK